MPSHEERERRALRGALLILLAGFAIALAIFLTARPEPPNPLGDEGDTKLSLLKMEEFGGQANVFAAEIRLWLVSLTHGRRLAITCFVAAAAAAWIYWFVVSTPPEEPRPNTRPPLPGS